MNRYLTVREQEQYRESENLILKTKNSEIKRRHKEKFEKLMTIQRKELNIIQNENWFVNKTEKNIPEDVRWLLSLGQKHAIPVTKEQFPMLKYIADGEDCIQTLVDKQSQERARSKFTGIVESYLNKRCLNNRERFVLNAVGQTKNFLRKNKDIFILKSDKGNVTVAMEKTDYETKMNIFLNDMMTYKRISKDPTSQLQKRNNDLVEELHKCNTISIIEKKRLKTDTAIAPRIYGLPKIHKDGCPLRPICSSINSPSSELCKFLTEILKNLTAKSEYNVRDAIQFKNKINNIKIEKNEKLVSFDVVSLFPSIPVEYAIDVIKSRWKEIEKHTRIPEDLFMRILNFCIKDNRYFKYKDKIFVQYRGLPMGSPASPVVADIVMEQLLKECFDEDIKKPRLLTKYVDDLFAIVKEDEIFETLGLLNSFHHRIKFTLEEEKNGRLPYLDTLIIREGNEIKIDWYQKPTSSGRIINFNSCQPKRIIINTAKNLIRRVMTLSDKQFHTKNKNKIRNILKMNGFTNNIITKLMKENIYNSDAKSNQETPKIYKSLIYVPEISERIEKSDIYDKEKYKIATTSGNVLRQFFTNTKNKIDKMDKSNLVYRIKCKGDDNNGCEMEYIGTTKNKLRTRIAGHKSDIKHKNRLITQKTALTTHCAETGHCPDLENIKIVQREEKQNKRYTLEMLHIMNTPPEKRINYKMDTDNCAQTYRHLITKTKLKS